jgi:hypothetical protein
MSAFAVTEVDLHDDPGGDSSAHESLKEPQVELQKVL